MLTTEKKPGVQDLDPRDRLVVLIVDDEQSVREVITMQLRERGFDVFAVADLRSAMMVVVDQRPDVILLDIRLGPENGLDIFSQLHDAALDDISIVALTGHAGPGEGFSAKELGAWDLLEKPADADEMAQVLSSAAAASRDAKLLSSLPRTVRSQVVFNVVRRTRRCYRIKGLSLDKIAREENVSPRTVSRTFQREMRCSVITYIHRCRIAAAMNLLKSTDLSAKEIAHECGYHNSSELHRNFRRHTGQSPMAFRSDAR